MNNLLKNVDFVLKNDNDIKCKKSKITKVLWIENRYPITVPYSPKKTTIEIVNQNKNKPIDDLFRNNPVEIRVRMGPQ